jgi:hypothetical protein
MNGKKRSSWAATCWNERFPCCVNCGETDRPRRRAGYCNACWPFARRLREVEKWNPEDPTTFVGAGTYRTPSAHFKKDGSREFAKAVQSRCFQGLGRIKNWERKNRGEEPIDGVYLEHFFDEVGDLLRSRGRKRFHGYATMLEHTLDASAKSLIHSMLTRLLLTRTQPDVIIRAYSDVYLPRTRK